MTEKKPDLSDIIHKIKKDFYCYRNGIVADVLKKLYPGGKIIYGLTVSQFLEISRKYPKDLEIGLKLWEDKKTRESRLLALYLIPPLQLSKELACEMVKDVESTEEAEFLAFRVLRNHPEAHELLEELNQEVLPNSLSVYCREMLFRNLNLST